MATGTQSGESKPMTELQKQARAEMLKRFNGGTTLTIGNDQLGKGMSQTLADMETEGLITVEHHVSSRTYRLKSSQ